MSDPDTERGLFEQAYARRFPFSCKLSNKFKRDEFDDYEDSRVFTAWEMWKIARQKEAD